MLDTRVEVDEDGRPIIWICQTPGGSVVGVFRHGKTAKAVMDGRPGKAIPWPIDCYLPASHIEEDTGQGDL
jgi:hypothetical protein